MTWPASPAWLQELQSRFGALLRTPLSRETGALEANIAAYDSTLVLAVKGSAAIPPGERLAVYQRQYWFRLFTVMQATFPLTARLLGFWRFNALGAVFLQESPPTAWDIEATGNGFDAFLERVAPPEGIPQQALVEAARIDAACHRVLRAPEVAPVRLDFRDTLHLSSVRLRPSPAVAIVHEHWPLCDLRRRALALAAEGSLSLPNAHSEEQHWLVGRQMLETVVVRLAPREAELLDLLGHHSVGEGLALLEERCNEAERGELPSRVREWLSRSVKLGVWAGLDT